MDARQFVEGYKEPANHIVAHHYEAQNPEVQELMEGPRRWTSFFDRQLILMMKGEHNGVNEPNALFNGLRTYQLDWSGPFLDTTYKTALDLSDRNFEAQPALSELNFHILSREMMPNWYKLFFGEQAVELDAPRIHEMQVRLALQGADLQNMWQKAGASDEKTGIHTGIQRRIGGQLTEIDSAIVLLEVMKQDGHSLPSTLVVVPAPPRFESAHNNRPRAADFLVFDTAADAMNMRGVQVKTFLDDAGKTNDTYDSAFVTLIDGDTDLGNTGRAYVAGRGHVSVPTPGMISLDYLLNRISVKDLSRHPRLGTDLRNVFRLRESAKANFGDRKSYIAQAAEHVGERLLHDLQNNPSE